MLGNSKKNRNIKTYNVNFISLARNNEFCFKSTYVSVFLCFRSIDVLYVVRHPLEKLSPTKPSYPLEITALEPPLPLGISNGLRGGGYGYFLEPHNPKKSNDIPLFDALPHATVVVFM